MNSYLNEPNHQTQEKTVKTNVTNKLRHTMRDSSPDTSVK